MIKELQINYKGTLSLQKHYHRSEHWVIIDGKPKVTLNNRIYELKTGDYIFIPVGGGGLISGIAILIKQLMPDIKVIAIGSIINLDKSGNNLLLNSWFLDFSPIAKNLFPK